MWNEKIISNFTSIQFMNTRNFRSKSNVNNHMRAVHKNKNISARHVYIGLGKKERSKFTNMQFIKNKNRFHIRFVYNFLEKIVFWIKIIILVHGTNKPNQCEKFKKILWNEKLFEISHRYSSSAQKTLDWKAIWTIT